MLRNAEVGGGGQAAFQAEDHSRRTGGNGPLAGASDSQSTQQNPPLLPLRPSWSRYKICKKKKKEKRVEDAEIR